MKSGILDTNILLYAANRDCREHTSARKFLENALRSAGLAYLTEGICYEFLRASTHPKVFPSPLDGPQALAWIHTLLEAPNFHLLSTGPNHWHTLSSLLSGLHAPSGKEHGIRTIYTADTDFLQFKELEVINPLSRT
ncbi:MAG: PIN domain-containing protein [Verrucomicrobia bacterium]|nr:PIN domain-containing protein [Verrucomicrobiota bacterium]